GTCHCGRCVFEVRGQEQLEAQDAARQVGRHAGAARPAGGSLLSMPRERLRLLSSEEAIGAYTFSGRMVGHRFCSVCGTHLYGEALDAAGPGTVFMNPACLSGVEPRDQDPAAAARLLSPGSGSRGATGPS